jgi:predicted RNase H-like HicB family nuclease
MWMVNRLEKRVLKSGTLPRIVDEWHPQASEQKQVHINIYLNTSGTSAKPQKRGGSMKTVVVLSPGEDGYIIAECPSLPGCISQGRDKNEAIDNIKEAIELYREVIYERGIKEHEVIEVEV